MKVTEGQLECSLPPPHPDQTWAARLDWSPTPLAALVLGFSLSLGACRLEGGPKDSSSAVSSAAPPAPLEEPAWIELFNGRDLTGWTPKLRGLPLGEDPFGTFVVRDGLLTVDYSQYSSWDERYGHLYHEGEFARYELKARYRFVGEQVSGGPGWAWRNNGLMLHCQPKASLTLGQEFPVSLEMQLLGGDGQNLRPNGNLCTPGTHVQIDGQLVTQHCIDSSGPTCHGDGWIEVQVLVDGADRIVHFVEGQAVLEYREPVLDPGDSDAQALLRAGFPARLERGGIAIQSESAPIQFSRIALRPLP